MSRGVLAIALIGAACWSASAAELTAIPSKENRTIVVLNGELAVGDASRFKEIVKASASAGRPVSALRLNSPGGSLIEGVRLAAVIHGTKIATVVGAGATCAGACFIPFVGGSQKFVSTTATVSVPGAASDLQPTGKTPAVVRVETPSIVRVVKAMGLLDAIVTRMLATSEGDAFQLSVDDLRAMGATMTGKPTQLR
ncbi:MAG: hypothetical protein J2P53_00890 [Bradyrhizobiaceae bacterium]|nr:hypothetical protein [Bradyrhizobiaceae bacterium]